MLTNSIKPNFLCVGAQKAGTTWLHHNLKKHPEVWLPPYKEVHYFDQIYLTLNERQIIEKKRLVNLRDELDGIIQGENISYSYLNFLAHLALSEVRDDNWYLSLFSSADSKRAVGEIAPGYSALPEEGVKHIKSLLGNINLIYILRNPVKRAWSQAVMIKRQDIYEKRHIKDEEWIRTIELKYSKLNSDYIRIINTYEKYFNKDEILYLFYDEICLNPLILLQKTCHFLDIKYDEQYFDESTLNLVFNGNPKVDVPEKVEQHLIQKYKKQEDWIRERFQPASFER